MASPWSKYSKPSTPKTSTPWSKYAKSPAQPQEPQSAPEQTKLISFDIKDYDPTKKPKTYYGNQAISKVEEILGGRKLSLMERRIVEEEAYVDGLYKDDAVKPVVTGGVGQTGEWIEKGFVAALEHHVERAKRNVKTFDTLPEDLQAEIVQLEYRGDLKLKSGKIAKWVKLLDEGKYKEASVELLNHSEYKRRKAKGDDGVTRRLEAARDMLLKYAE